VITGCITLAEPVHDVAPNFNVSGVVDGVSGIVAWGHDDTDARFLVMQYRRLWERRVSA